MDQDAPVAVDVDEEAFRSEVRAWLAANAADYVEPHDWPEGELVARSLAWKKLRAAAGFGLVRGPRDLGGREGTAQMATIFAQEEAAYHTPTFIGLGIGFGMALPTIKKHGAPEQYRRFAEPTINGDASWCQLFSEPAAGSDLAGIRTKAVRDGDNWIVNGQKV